MRLCTVERGTLVRVANLRLLSGVTSKVARQTCQILLTIHTTKRLDIAQPLFLSKTRNLVFDFLPHPLHRRHFDQANSLCGHAVFVGEYLQHFFLIFGEPAERDDVSKSLTFGSDDRRPTASRPRSIDVLATPRMAQRGRPASDRSSPPHPWASPWGCSSRSSRGR